MIESKIPPPNTIHTIVIAPVVPPPSERLVTGAEPPPWVGKALKWVFPVAAILFIALIAVPGFLQKWLWMRQLDYAGIFWTLFSVKVALTAAAFVSAFAFLWLNLWQANRSGTVQADYKPLAAAGSGDVGRSGQAQSHRSGSPHRGAEHSPSGGRSLSHFRGRSLCAVGYMAAFSLRGLLRPVPTPYSEWIWAFTCSACPGIGAAEQFDDYHDPCHRGRRMPVRLLGTSASSTVAEKSKSRIMPRNICPYCCSFLLAPLDGVIIWIDSISCMH